MYGISLNPLQEAIYSVNSHNTYNTENNAVTSAEVNAEKIDTLLDELYTAHKQAQYESIGEKAAEALHLSHRISYDAGVIRSLMYKGIDYRLRENYSSALKELDEALSLARRGKYKDLESQILNQQSIVYSLLGNTIGALEVQTERYTICETLGNKAEIAYCLHQIGNSYYALQQWESALDFLQRSAEIKKTLGNEWSYATTLNSLGVVHENMGNYRVAIVYYSQALTIKEKYPQKISVAFSLHNLANAYYYSGKILPAMEFAYRGMAIKREVGNTRALTTSLCLLARIHITLAEYQQALSFAKEALEIAENLKATDRIASAHEVLAIYYKATGDFESALYHYEQYSEITRRAFNEESRTRLEQLSAALRTDAIKKELEKAQQQAEGLVHELSQKNKDLTTMSLILAQKNEMLNKFRIQVEQIRLEGMQTPESATAHSEKLLLLEQEITVAVSSEKAWETFDQQFHTIHHEYVQKVSSLYPDLTPTELRVCAMLKLNLTTKEIANVLYISVKTVEMYRFRIRKKFGLDPSVNLSTFLASL